MDIKKSLKEKVNNLPSLPGIYLMKDEYGNIIYIGKAKNLKNRVSSYFVNTQKPLKVVQMVNNVFTFDYIITNSELDALNLESNLIKKHKPFYNILLKDGKGHSFIKINLKDDFPKLEVTRQVKNDGAKYFGPFFAGVSVRDVLKIINSTFMLRDCNLKINENKPYKRECLNYFLGLCSAPCTNRISKQDYKKEVLKVMDFLNGNLDEAKQILTEKMQLFASLENFERAIELRESLKLIEKLKNTVVTELKKDLDIDVFGYATNGFYSVISVLVVRAGKMVGISNHFVVDSSLSDSDTIGNFILQYYPHNSTVPKLILVNEELDQTVMEWLQSVAGFKVEIQTPKMSIKKKLLQMANQNASEYLEKNIETSKKEWLKTYGAVESLKRDLNLQQKPVRIECYDISNFQGTHIVASMVVFVNGMPQKSHYRKFKITSVYGKNNDFESMREVLTRRLNNLNSQDESFKNMPNLIVIDGGKGQLGVAQEVLSQFNINCDLISLAKNIEEVFVPNKKESIYLSRDNSGLKLLQRIRDEAHRFAITFHRSLRSKSQLISELTNIEGVGDKTAKLLLTHFEGIENVKNATYDDLLKVKGISKTVASNIVNYFQNN